MTTTLSTRVIKFHKTFFCLGTDSIKVKNGIEDNTEMSDIDISKNWNKGVCLSSKKKYSEFGYTRKEVIDMNNKFWEYQVIN